MSKVRKFKILLVDDSPNILKALMRTLRGEGYDIKTAGSADEAMTVLKSEPIDLIVADENMPGKTGTELLATIKDEYPEVIRFMITGMNDMEVVKRAVNEGEIYRFFSKPWDEFELILALRYALENKYTREKNRELVKIVKRQQDILNELEKEHPGISQRNITVDGTYVIDA